MQDGRVVGTITSGEWGHRVGKNIAYAFVDADLSDAADDLTVDICGMLIPAAEVAGPLYDPNYDRCRA